MVKLAILFANCEASDVHEGNDRVNGKDPNAEHQMIGRLVYGPELARRLEKNP